MNYCTVSDVRKLSGLKQENYVTSSDILRHIKHACGIVNSYLQPVYTTPLIYRVKNTITFSGEGTGSGTLSVTVGGNSFDINIENGKTEEDCADDLRELFRLDDYDFYNIDSIGDGEIVTVVSKKNSLELSQARIEVAVVGDSDNGILATAGTIVEYYPSMINYLASALASSLALDVSYGIEGQDTPKDGTSQLEYVYRRLNDLKSGKTKLIDDVTGLPFESSNVAIPKFYPNNLSRNSTTNTTAPYITQNTEF